MVAVGVENDWTRKIREVESEEIRWRRVCEFPEFVLRQEVGCGYVEPTSVEGMVRLRLDRLKFDNVRSIEEASDEIKLREAKIKEVLRVTTNKSELTPNNISIIRACKVEKEALLDIRDELIDENVSRFAMPRNPWKIIDSSDPLNMSLGIEYAGLFRRNKDGIHPIKEMFKNRPEKLSLANRILNEPKVGAICFFARDEILNRDEVMFIRRVGEKNMLSIIPVKDLEYTADGRRTDINYKTLDELGNSLEVATIDGVLIIPKKKLENPVELKKYLKHRVDLKPVVNKPSNQHPQ